MLLENGNWHQIKMYPENEERGQAFEHYFEQIGYYSIYVQWTEGKCYKLVSEKDGSQQYLIGRPFLSDDKKTIISINRDVTAQFSGNGIQLLKITEDKIIPLGYFNPETWGIDDLKWVSSTDAILKCTSYKGSDFNDFSPFNFYLKLSFEY